MALNLRLSMSFTFCVRVLEIVHYMLSEGRWWPPGPWDLSGLVYDI